MVIRPILLFRLICNFLTMFTGNTIIATSNSASMIPVENQNRLKLKQCAAGLRLFSQLHLTGQQLKMSASVQAAQNRTRSTLITQTWRRKDDEMAKIRLYMSRIESLAGHTML